jgi:hypothetical protein
VARRAYVQACAAAAQPQYEPGGQQAGDQDDHQAIRRIVRTEHRRGAADGGRRVHRMRVVAPDQDDHAIDHEGQTERHQPHFDVRPVLEPAEEAQLEAGADDGEAERRDDQGKPERRLRRHGVGQVSPQHVERAVREVHHSAQSVNHGKP